MVGGNFNRRPIARVEADDLVDLNRRVLLETAFEGDRPHGVQNPAGLRRAAAVAQRLFLDDPHKRATLLCCAIIANHPFNDGNHRTSLEAATLQLLLDGWFYEATEDEEKRIYNWRFDYEEEHGLEALWMSTFGGWDTRGEEQHLIQLLESEYGRKIEGFLREHTTPAPFDSFLPLLPPQRYAAIMRAYPASAWKKQLNRQRRTNASRWRKTYWPMLESMMLHDEEARAARKPRKHWRPEKL